MYPIVMFVGKAGSGKDTAAGMLNEVAGGLGVSLAAPLKNFAKDVLNFPYENLWGPSKLRNVEINNMDQRSICKRFFVEDEDVARQWLNEVELPDAMDLLRGWVVREFDGTHPLTARRILQSLGTEFGRTVNPDVWINYGIKNATKLLGSGCNLVTISDGRFRNEVLAVKKVGGIVVKIIDPDAKELPGGASAHASETELKTIPDFWFDEIIKNDKTAGLDYLRQQIAVLNLWTLGRGRP